MRTIILMTLALAFAVTAAALPAVGASEHGRGCDITGTSGRDKLIGTRADEVICGLGGNDILRGRRGSDSLLGGKGHDILWGGRADDLLAGGAKQDFLYSLHRGHDTDTLRGNGGNDVFITHDGHKDIINGGHKKHQWDIACADRHDILRSAKLRDACPGGPPTGTP